MKRYAMILVLLILIVFTTFLASGAPLSVVNSKHNLSGDPANPSTYKSVDPATDLFGTSEVCVFCHTPHGGNTEAPLWNRNLYQSTPSGYAPYTSDVLSALSYTVMDDPYVSTGAGLIHAKTRICLSCHDGTIAMGKLASLPYGLSNDIPIQNTTGGLMPNAAAGYIGANFKDDHPVAIMHDNAKDPELELAITSDAPNVNLYRLNAGKVEKIRAAGAANYVECTSCHSPHDNQYGNFLVDPNQNSKICTSCHRKELGSATPAHDNATGVGYDPDGSGSLGTSVGQVKCMNCHFPHKSGITDTTQLPLAQPADTMTNPRAGYYLLSFLEEMSCFSNDSLNNHRNRWGQVSNVCHGNGATNGSGKTIDIETDVNRASAHRVGDQAGRHQAVEVKTGTSNGWFSSGVWHVECQDCHNPHTAGTAVHSKGTNTISSFSPLYGVSYVRVTGVYPGGSWTAPNLYSPVEPLGATNSTTWASDVKEYEICFKCHSYFAPGAGSFPNAPSNGQQMTDQSMEFNSNASYHPVVASNPNTNGAYISPWSSGSQLMYCSDCHTKENNASPQGAHGSTNPFLLSKPYFDNTAAPGSDETASTFCMGCHDQNTYINNGTGTNTGFSGGGVNLHTRHAWLANNSVLSAFSYRCVNCHIRIPHGWQQRKGMVFVQGDPAGAMYAPVSGPTITWTSLPASGSYASTNAAKNNNCMTIIGCHQ